MAKIHGKLGMNFQNSHHVPFFGVINAKHQWLEVGRCLSLQGLPSFHHFLEDLDENVGDKASVRFRLKQKYEGLNLNLPTMKCSRI